MIYKETKPCAVCGEYYPLHQLERVFTGRTQLVCYKCSRRGAEYVGKRLYKRMVRKENR